MRAFDVNNLHRQSILETAIEAKIDEERHSAPFIEIEVPNETPGTVHGTLKYGGSVKWNNGVIPYEFKEGALSKYKSK